MVGFQFTQHLSPRRVSNVYLFSQRKESNITWAEMTHVEDYLGEINVLEDFAHGGDDIIDAPSYHVLMDLAYNTWVTAVELMTHYTSMS